MSPRRRDENGVVGVALTIVIIFALIAVIELTRTVVAAQQINTRVMDITGSVNGANKHLNSVPELDGVNDSAKAILVAAQPLSGQAKQIIDAATSINGTAGQIQTNATAINGTVHAIGASATSVNASVHSINNELTTLLPVTQSIQAGVAAINGRADKVIALAAGIKGDTSNIIADVGARGQLATIFGQANAIDCGILVSGGACNK